MVEIVKILKLLIGNKEDASNIFEFKATIIKYMVPKLITPNMMPAGIARVSNVSFLIINWYSNTMAPNIKAVENMVDKKASKSVSLNKLRCA